MALKLTQLQKDQISSHDYHINGTLTHPFESIQMGNGDIGASVSIYSHEVKITLAKSDVWDARVDGKPEETVLTQDDLIDMMKEKQRDLLWKNDFPFTSKAYNFQYKGEDNHGPFPKRLGAIRVYHPGLSNTKVVSHLHLLTGILETRFKFAKGELILKFFIQKSKNKIWVTAEGSGQIPWVAFIIEKEPDDVDRTLPFPQIDSIDEYTGVLTQKIPAGLGVDDFQWSLAGGFPEPQKGIDTQYLEAHAYRYRYYCSFDEGQCAIMSIGAATSRDGPADTVTRAADLARLKSHHDYKTALEQHVSDWEEFWARSGITLDDKELESVWFRNHFAYGCAMREGITALGIGGNVSVSDSLPWRGDYHMNHNFQKWYVTALPTNHPEWIEIYADFVRDKMDTFEYQAKLIFGLEGAYCDLVYFPYSPKEHSIIHNHMGRALALTGWLAQPLWWHFEYLRDVNWLEQKAYPYIKKAAQFYYNYLNKYMDETGDIYPSLRIEEPHNGFYKNFRGSRNVISDLVMFKKCFEWAISASEILDVDKAWREKWNLGLTKVPEIRYGWENGEGYVELDSDLMEQPDGEKAEAARTIRWAGGGWPVFPGEYIDGHQDDELTRVFRDMMRRTNLLDPFTRKDGTNRYAGTPVIHPISSVIPTIRLGVLEKFDNVRDVILAHRLTYGQASSYMLAGDKLPWEIMSYSGYLWYDWRSVENKYLGVIGTTEMLLQSQGGTIHLFSFYPASQDAAFRGLRARGGFIVDASRKAGVISCDIYSEAGQLCKISWDSSKPEISCDDRPVNYKIDNHMLVFQTDKGRIYKIKANKSD